VQEGAGDRALPLFLKLQACCAEQRRVRRRPPYAALGVLVVASFIVRAAAGWLSATPTLFPDEYIYSAVGRSLADSGRPQIRGASAHFPALLEPILTAPAWLIGDVDTAFRVVQAIGALAMSLAAIPVYFVAVRLGLSRWIALAVAALAVLVPDLLYASFVSSEPFAYPLVLAAIASATIALTQPSRRAQLAFVAFAALAALTRAQLVVLPLVFVLAALILGMRERRLRETLCEQLLPIVLFLLPVLAVGLAGPSHVLGYYRSVLHLNLHPIVFLRWSGWDLMVLAYAAAWIIVPGALLGLWFALRRPATRLEQTFAVLVVLLTAALVSEAGLLQANAAGRTGLPVNEIKERYVFYLVPLFGLCFALYAKRGWPARIPHLLLTSALLILAVRVPLSGFAIAPTINASPILFAVYWLTGKVGSPGNAAGVVAVAAGVMSVAAVVASRRPRLGTPVVLALTVLVAGAASAGAVAFDVNNTSVVKKLYLPKDPSWVDRAGLGNVSLLQAAGGQRAASLQELFWNRSITRVILLPGATPFDVFHTQGMRVDGDGTMRVGRRPLDGPLAVDGFGSTVLMRGARRLASAPTAALWVPVGRPRLSLYAAGRYFDGWLAASGAIALWPEAAGRPVSGWLSMRITTPASWQPQTITFRLPSGRSISVHLRPGAAGFVRIPACSRGRWSATFRSKRFWLSGVRPVSAKASVPVFTPDRGACPAGTDDRRASF